MSPITTRPAVLAAAFAWTRASARRLQAFASTHTPDNASRWLAFAAPLLLLAGFEMLAYSAWGSDWLVLVKVAVFGLAAIALLAVVLLLPSALVPRWRADALRRVVVPALFLAGTILGAQANKLVRAHGWQAVAARGDAIVVAIHAYETAHGAPPPSLAGLVPGFIGAVPGTGLGSRPEFRYDVTYGKPGDATFRLWTKLPGINHVSDFEYLPEADARAWNTVLHRVGAWAVVAND